MIYGILSESFRNIYRTCSVFVLLLFYKHYNESVPKVQHYNVPILEDFRETFESFAFENPETPRKWWQHDAL